MLDDLLALYKDNSDAIDRLYNLTPESIRKIHRKKFPNKHPEASKDAIENQDFAWDKDANKARRNIAAGTPKEAEYKEMQAKAAEGRAAGDNADEADLFLADFDNEELGNTDDPTKLNAEKNAFEIVKDNLNPEFTAGLKNTGNAIKNAIKPPEDTSMTTLSGATPGKKVDLTGGDGSSTDGTETPPPKEAGIEPFNVGDSTSTNTSQPVINQTGGTNGGSTTNTTTSAGSAGDGGSSGDNNGTINPDPNDPNTQNAASKDPRTNYQLKSIYRAYKDGDIDKGTAQYLAMDAIANFARDMAKGQAQLASIYFGGKPGAIEPSETLWDKRNKEMMKQGISAEAATVNGSDQAMKRAAQTLELEAQRVGITSADLDNQLKRFQTGPARYFTELANDPNLSIEQKAIYLVMAANASGNDQDIQDYVAPILASDKELTKEVVNLAKKTTSAGGKVAGWLNNILGGE